VVVFSEIEQARPNKFGIIASIVGRLWAKLGSVQVTYSKTFQSDDHHSRVDLFQSACEVCVIVKFVLRCRRQYQVCYTL